MAQWLRRCTKNRKVAGSIPAGVIGIFHWHKILPIALWSWGRLRLWQKWVPGTFPGGKGSQCIGLRNLPPSCAVVVKFEYLNFLEPSGPLQACNGTALPYILHHIMYLHYLFLKVWVLTPWRTLGAPVSLTQLFSSVQGLLGRLFWGRNLGWRCLRIRVLRRIFGPKRDVVTGEWRKLHNGELNDLYSPNIVRVIKSRRMRWAGHLAPMGERRGVTRVLLWKAEGKRSLGRPRHRWDDNIKMDLQEVDCGGMDWIELAQYDRWGHLWVR